MAYLQMCSISSMVRLLGIVFPISVFFRIYGSGLHDREPYSIDRKFVTTHLIIL